MSARPDFQETRQMPAEACTEKGFENEPGVGPQGKGLRPIVLMLIVCAVSPLVWLGFAHFAARFW